MSDLISREAAIDALITLWLNKPFGNPALTEIRECVERVPSAQPEIIRCKDCKYGGMKEFEEGYCGGGAIDQEITGMDYCSWAERRTDGKTD